MYKVILEKQVLKFLEKHKGEMIMSQFEKSVIELINNPFESNLDIKSIKGLDHHYRLRIGKYRFLYEIIEDTISISFFKAGSRGEVYKNM